MDDVIQLRIIFCSQLLMILLLIDLIWLLARIQQRCSKIARSATLHIKGACMPATIVIGGKGAVAVYQEWDGPNGTGNKVAPTGVVTYSSDDPTIASVDPATGEIIAVAAGSTNINGVDVGTGLKASDSVTVQGVPPPPVAASATLVVTAN